MRGIPESPSPPVASPEPTLQPLDPRLSAVSIAFAAFAVLLVAAGISLLAEVGLLGRLKDGGPVTRSQLAASDDRQALFAVLVLIAYIVAGIVWIRFFHRAYVNTGALGGARRYGPGWAIGSWFVPFLNLVRPVQIAGEIWDGGRVPGQEDKSGTGLIMTWWALWVIGSISWRLLKRRSADSLVALQHADEVLVGIYAVNVAGLVLAVMVASRMTRRLNARARQLSATATQPPGTHPAEA